MELIGRHFGHIRVTQVVGQGGMGDVYGGYDEKLERKVALKVLNDDQRLDAEARERLLREARALSRLDHPNICRIHDYIETPDVDLLVLEYIDGKTLHDAMQERMARHEKLRIAVAIADVLVQAHRAGIVHRDLKPENVMLTKSGEVKVLDFGLARWLHRTKGRSSGKQVAVRSNISAFSDATETTPFSFDDAPSEHGPRRDFLATAVGITLGTPLFMSPEQARGESLTPASDMFSFGLLLQTLFTGEDPHPIDLTAREVILRVARGETQAVKGAHGDVTALINRLKQLAPADRPTAVETAERLRFLANRAQRIARRGIAAAVALVLLVGAWRYVVDLRAERAIAVRERAEAQKRRADVENLLEFMLGDLRKKLEPVGRLEVLDDVAERALAYSASLQPSQLSVEELVRNAKALHQLAQVRIAQGKLDAAFESANRALGFADEAARRDGQAPDVQLALATSRFWVGNVRRLRGELPEALGELQRYRDITVRLAEAYPSNDEYQLERAYGHSAVATILEAQGDCRGALVEHEPTVAVNRARAAADPTNTAKQVELAYTLNKTGNVLRCLARFGEAQQRFEAEHAIYAHLVQSDPRQWKWQDRLANSHSYLAALFEVTGDTNKAMEHRRAQFEIYRTLYDHDPSNADWKRNYALSTMRVANLLREGSDLRGALLLYVRSETLLDEIIDRDSTRPTWRRDLAVVQIAHARALLAAGLTAEAGRLARSAESTLLKLSVKDSVTRRSLADSQIAIGDTHSASGDSTAARAAWTRALATIGDQASGTSDPVILETWVRALLRMDQVDVARPVLVRLRAMGYRHGEFERLVARAH